jgi:DNA polymerase elongation subunit (family B)
MNIEKISDQELIRLRNELKNDANNLNMLQKALKIQLNSAYGALGCKYFRFYDARQAEAITISGQMVAFYIEKKLNEKLNQILKTNDQDFIIAMDTDSWYLNLEKLVQKFYPEFTKDKMNEMVSLVDKICEQKLQKIFDENFKRISEKLNTPKNTMSVKREAIANKGIWTAKKQYMLNVYDIEGKRNTTPKVLVKGLEGIKSSIPDLCRDAIQKVYYLILNNSEKELQNYISDFKKQFCSATPEEIAKYSKVSFLDKYDVRSLSTLSSMTKGAGIPYNSKAALAYNFLLGITKTQNQYPPIQEGDKIGILYLYVPNPWGVETIGFSDVLPKEFNLNNHINYDIQFNKTFLDPVERILTLINWKSKEQPSLFSMME